MPCYSAPLQSRCFAHAAAAAAPRTHLIARDLDPVDVESARDAISKDVIVFVIVVVFLVIVFVFTVSSRPSSPCLSSSPLTSSSCSIVNVVFLVVHASHSCSHLVASLRYVVAQNIAKTLSTVHCPLSTVHCPLSTVHCPLSTVHCPLSFYIWFLAFFHFLCLLFIIRFPLFQRRTWK